MLLLQVSICELLLSLIKQYVLDEAMAALTQLSAACVGLPGRQDLTTAQGMWGWAFWVLIQQEAHLILPHFLFDIFQL